MSFKNHKESDHALDLNSLVAFFMYEEKWACRKSKPFKTLLCRMEPYCTKCHTCMYNTYF